MQIGNRMASAKEALKLFLRSLPKDTHFSVISFGSRFTALEYNGSNTIPYNEQSMSAMIQQIDQFTPDHGGTDIVTPLREAQRWQFSPCQKKRVFILTDGCV